MQTNIELRHRAVITILKRTDINQIAEKHYRQNFSGNDKIFIREYYQDDTKIIWEVADRDKTQPLYFLKIK